MSDVFISYSREDAPLARQLASALETRGLTVFFDMETLVSGEDFAHRITSEISTAKAVIVLLSAHSSRSKWVENELQTALDASGVVIPVLLDEEGTKNWVWPLLADRQAIVSDSAAGTSKLINRIADAVESAIGNNSMRGAGAETPLSHRLAENASWSRWIFPILTAIAGAAITWFFMM